MRAVLLDLYGTMLDLPSDSRPFAQIVRGLRGSGRRAALEAALTSENSTLESFSARIDSGHSVDAVASLEVSLRADLARVRLFSDVVPTLDALDARGVRVAVVSNLATPYVEPFHRLGLGSRGVTPVFSCERGVAKPDPAIYAIALRELGVHAEEALMVGDSLRNDVLGPEAVGIPGLHLVRSGSHSVAGLVVRSLENVLE